MTPKKAAAIARELNVKCDEAFMFACKVGSGCHVSCKGSSNPIVYLTMILTLLDGVFERLNGSPEKCEEFKSMFSRVLLDYVKDISEEDDDDESRAQA